MRKIVMLVLVMVASLIAKELTVKDSASLRADSLVSKAQKTLKGFEVGVGYSNSFLMREERVSEAYYDKGYYGSITYKFKPSYGVRFTYSKIEDVEFIKELDKVDSYSVSKVVTKNKCEYPLKSEVEIKPIYKKEVVKSESDVERYFIDALFYTKIKGYEFYKILGFGYSDEDRLYKENIFVNVGVGYYRELYKGLGVSAEVKLLESLDDDFRKPEFLTNVGLTYRF